MTLLRLLDHPLACFLGEIVDIGLGHQHLDAVDELLRRPTAIRHHDILFDEMDLDAEVIDRRPVLQIAVEPVSLLDQNDPNRRMPAQIAQHVAEGGPTAFPGGFHVDMARYDGDAVQCRIIFQQLDLSGDRIAFTLLLRRGDPCIQDRLADLETINIITVFITAHCTSRPCQPIAPVEILSVGRVPLEQQWLIRYRNDFEKLPPRLWACLGERFFTFGRKSIISSPEGDNL